MLRNCVLLVLCFYGAYGTTRDRLLTELMQSYTKELKPDGKVSMDHSISLQNINYNDGIVTAEIWNNQGWVDNRLQWDPNDWDQVEKLKIPSSLLWKPDVLLYNSVGSNSGMKYKDINAVVSHNGKVLWIPPMQLKTQCEEQRRRKNVVCAWKFGSWVYDGFEFEFVNGTQSFDTSTYTSNAKYEIIRTDVVIHKTIYTCCPEPYYDATYTLEFKKLHWD